jgi:hypothetical protein
MVFVYICVYVYATRGSGRGHDEVEVDGVLMPIMARQMEDKIYYITIFPYRDLHPIEIYYAVYII